MPTTRNPVLFDHDGPAIDRHAPMLGEHSEEVLAALGYSQSAIRDLVAAGVVQAVLAEALVARVRVTIDAPMITCTSWPRNPGGGITEVTHYRTFLRRSCRSPTNCAVSTASGITRRQLVNLGSDDRSEFELINRT